MSSSGLIYAVIVGAWAAYLVPMWLRRQDELNEARPTERFSTAIRLLSGKAAMERRYAKEAERRDADAAAAPSGDDDADRNDPEGTADASVDVRAFAEPKTMAHEALSGPEGGLAADGAAGPEGVRPEQAAARGPADRQAVQRKAARDKAADRKAAERSKRAKVLARRRRTTMMLFLCFSVGAIVAAVGGVAFLWAPAVPAALLSAYIAHLRTQERRRFQVTMDRRRAEEAARHLRERGDRTRATRVADAERTQAQAQAEAVPAAPPRPSPPTPSASAAERPSAADRRALVEQTDHAEWVDQERGRVREQPEGEGWEPVPVPLPTYVNAPVAPRTARGVDLDAPDAWSSARSTAAPSGPEPEASPARPRSPGSRRDRTPLFDQMADKDRPRAANE